MLNLSEKTKSFIERNFDDADKLLNTSDPNVLLKALYFLIEEKGFNEDYSYNTFGSEAQDIYDDVYEFA